VVPNSKEEHSFSYTVEGVTENGVFVLQAQEWGGGGTGVFPSLLFVRIRQDMGFGELKDDKLDLTRKRILIEILGEIPLGDRVSSDIKIDGNTVMIQSEQHLPPNEKSIKKITISLEDK
jgi:hypothetical protein